MKAFLFSAGGSVHSKWRPLKTKHQLMPLFWYFEPVYSFFTFYFFCISNFSFDNGSFKDLLNMLLIMEQAIFLKLDPPVK